VSIVSTDTGKEGFLSCSQRHRFVLTFPFATERAL
jgi:hypothetical protein